MTDSTQPRLAGRQHEELEPQEYIAWFKFHEENHGACHDFDPAWEYEALGLGEAPDIEMILALEGPRLQREIARTDHLNGFEVFLYRKPETQEVGSYMNGTTGLTVLGIECENLRKACDESGKELVFGVVTTVAHELGHGLQEDAGLELDEDTAELFAKHYWMTGELDLALLGIPDSEPGPAPGRS